MIPTFKIEELKNPEDKIETGSLVIYNARIGEVFSGSTSHWYVFNFKTASEQEWPKIKTKLFKGKLIIEQ